MALVSRRGTRGGEDGVVTAQPPPPPPAPQPTGWIALTIQGSVLTSNVVTPSVRLNGYPVGARYGENLLPVPPGPWQIDVSCPWMWSYGRAALDCQVAEGQTVPVFYAPPYHAMSRGAIGHTPQSRRGLGVLLFGLVAAVAVVVLFTAFLAVA